MNKQCIVVFPVYRSLDPIELAVFEHAVAMTEGFRHVFIAPQWLSLDPTFGNLASLDVVRFDDHFFDGIEGYNRLMLSAIFYNAFVDYNYILIHQSDAYLFEPKLAYWCNKDYDYIGAPWFKPHKLQKGKFYDFILRYLPVLYTQKAKRRHQLYNNVGNGGLSLRKVSTFNDVLEKVSTELLSRYLSEKHTEFNEDIFWGVEAQKIVGQFKKPNWDEALKFAFEANPEIAFEFNGRCLPFGCHAFNVHGVEFGGNTYPFCPITKANIS